MVWSLGVLFHLSLISAALLNSPALAQAWLRAASDSTAEGLNTIQEQNVALGRGVSDILEHIGEHINVTHLCFCLTATQPPGCALRGRDVGELFLNGTVNRASPFETVVYTSVLSHRPGYRFSPSGAVFDRATNLGARFLYQSQLLTYTSTRLGDGTCAWYMPGDPPESLGLSSGYLAVGDLNVPNPPAPPVVGA